jgi:eukaryotic-like serine/threonine-protein kinase
MTLAPGTRLGPYEIVGQIGAGGMGEVYKARDSKLDRFVAVKVLPAALAGTSGLLARFEREAKAVGALSHPGILGIFDFGSAEGTPYAVMELLEGETLRDRLRAGALPMKKAVEFAAQVAQALAAAHGKGIIHRDLKPENLFITSEGRIKILDFGLAKQLPAFGKGNQSETPTQAFAQGSEPGTVLGTVGYMSPEQVRGEPADHRSDIFSLGCVLFEMLTGRRAFDGATAVDALHGILNSEPDLDLPSISLGLHRLLEHCLEKDPALRFQSAQDLAYALGSIPGGSSREVDVAGLENFGHSGLSRRGLLGILAGKP